MNKLIELQVIEFVADATGANITEVFAHSDLLKDLGVDGDDAIELIEDFSKKFNVDISGFEFQRYFYPEEPVTFLRLLIVLFEKCFSSSKNNPSLLPLLVGDLVKAVEKGTLLYVR